MLLKVMNSELHKNSQSTIIMSYFDRIIPLLAQYDDSLQFIYYLGLLIINSMHNAVVI